MDAETYGRRVPLTVADALAGVRPAPFSRLEWWALTKASETYHEALRARDARRLGVPACAGEVPPSSCYWGGEQGAASAARAV